MHPKIRAVECHPCTDSRHVTGPYKLSFIIMMMIIIKCEKPAWLWILKKPTVKYWYSAYYGKPRSFPKYHFVSETVWDTTVLGLLLPSLAVFFLACDSMWRLIIMAWLASSDKYADDALCDYIKHSSFLCDDCSPLDIADRLFVYKMRRCLTVNVFDFLFCFKRAYTFKFRSISGKNT